MTSSPRWFSSLIAAPAVAAVGMALAGAVVAAFAAFAVYERGQVLAAQRARVELLARVLDDHGTRSFEAVSLALIALGETISAGEPAAAASGARRGAGPGAAEIDRGLANVLAGVPLLRGVAVLDGAGHVLASTAPAEVGLHIDLARLGPVPAAGSERIGGFVAGRGLEALATGPAAAGRAAIPAGVGFVPVLRRLPTEGQGEDRLLIGLVNTDAVANHHTQILDDEGLAAVLASYPGQVLAATRSAGRLPGDSIAALPAFTQFLPKVEHATVVGDGLRPGPQVSAFRTSRTRPLVVMVESSMADVQAQWKSRLVLPGAVAALALAGILLAASLATRAWRTRQAARQQVAARERELSVIFQSVQELLFRTDAQGRLTFVNARWAAATGASEAATLGHPLSKWVAPASVDEARRLFEPGGEAGVRSATLTMGPAHAPRRFEMAVLPLRTDSQLSGYAGSAVDVTERHRAQEKLQAQLAFTELLIQAIPLPMSVLDDDNRYVTVNPAWEEFTGSSRAEVVGTFARDRFTDEQVAEHEEHNRALSVQGGRTRYEAVVRHHDGSHRDVAITKAALPGGGGVIVAFMDVSEFREAERAVREARDLAEEASRAKSEFIANISHELRTPLQSIIGFSELGAVRAQPHPRFAGMFQDIHTAGQRMLALVNDLLDVSKLESSVGTLHLERTDVRGLVREAVRELEPQTGARGLHITIDMCEAPLVAKVDPLRYLQVLRNVLANAIRFSPEGALIEVSADIDADYMVRVEVRDHGPGIPPAELDAIFEAFVQSTKTRDGSGGTGLGLTICRKIIDAHSGHIAAANAPDGGSVFRICVPARTGNTTNF